MNNELCIMHCALCILLFELVEEAVYEVEVGAAVVIPVLAQSSLVGESANALWRAYRESAFLLCHSFGNHAPNDALPSGIGDIGIILVHIS